MDYVFQHACSINQPLGVCYVSRLRNVVCFEELLPSRTISVIGKSKMKLGRPDATSMFENYVCPYSAAPVLTEI